MTPEPEPIRAAPAKGMATSIAIRRRRGASGGGGPPPAGADWVDESANDWVDESANPWMET